jgi:hypothetical protein
MLAGAFEDLHGAEFVLGDTHAHCKHAGEKHTSFVEAGAARGLKKSFGSQRISFNSSTIQVASSEIRAANLGAATTGLCEAFLSEMRVGRTNQGKLVESPLISASECVSSCTSLGVQVQRAREILGYAFATLKQDSKVVASLRRATFTSFGVECDNLCELRSAVLVLFLHPTEPGARIGFSRLALGSKLGSCQIAGDRSANAPLDLILRLRVRQRVLSRMSAVRSSTSRSVRAIASDQHN